MKNWVSPGDSVTIPAPANGILSGDIVQVGFITGVAAHNANQNDDLTIAVEGIYDVAKAPNEAWAIGEPIQLDASNRVASKTGADGYIGYAVAVAANPSSVGRVKLVPVVV